MSCPEASPCVRCGRCGAPPEPTQAMCAELDALLCQRHPRLFAERGARADSSPMARGFECGDGWFALIDALCERLQAETDEAGAPQVVAAQVKAKLGTLRFRTHGPVSGAQRALIRMAEVMSSRLCAQCGAALPGVPAQLTTQLPTPEPRRCSQAGGAQRDPSPRSTHAPKT